MKNNSRAMVLAAFVADALGLGVHWVYNTHVIDRKFGRVETFVDPLTSYHTGKKKGDFTNIGDQSLVLLKSVAENPKFDLKGFTQRWQDFFKTYQGYFDKATKTTLENLETGQSPEQSGSDSDELSGACRIAPLIYSLNGEIDTLVSAVKAQTKMSHNNPITIETAEFLARVTVKVLNGHPPIEAMKQVAEDMQASEQLKEWLKMGIESASGETRQVIDDFGKACAMSYALPGAIHLIVKYEGDFKEAMVENVMAGGDTSARGMAAGMVLGAWNGETAIPAVWLDELNARSRIDTLIDRLDRVKP
jgi:ADP-ribosylglycohydrolase